jgi:hypothetical protein
MAVEVSPNDASTAVCSMMMLHSLAEIFEHIVGRVEVAPGVRLIDVSREFAP